MLLAGAVADVVGSRVINLLGIFSLSVFILATCLARSGIQVIMFRMFQGVGVAMCFPTAVSILSAELPSGRVQIIGFACLGLGTPVGFATGIMLGGVLETEGAGWRLGYIYAPLLPWVGCIVATAGWCDP